MLWLTKGVSIRLLARTAGRTWVRCRSGRTASRYVDCVVPCKRVEVEERLGPCWAPLAMRTYRTGVKALSCQSRADESEGFVGSKPCGWSDGNEGFVGSKPCGRADGNEGFVGSKPCGRIVRERRLCRVKAVRTGQKAEAKMGVIFALRR